MRNNKTDQREESKENKSKRNLDSLNIVVVENDVKMFYFCANMCVLKIERKTTTKI